MARFVAPGAVVTIDPQKLASVLRSANGPVMRDMIERGEKVKRRAQQLVGVDSGRLRASIVKRIGIYRGRPAVFVGSDVPYALLHHEGTVPHRIQGRPLLVFYWPRVGRVVAFRHVNHPGTDPNRYLLNALSAAR